jgi:uncharacterized DUF497 family protein
MSFGWDPSKSDKNARDRGLPFEIATALFDGDTIEFDDKRRDYGERRILAYGIVSGRVLVCVYTWRGAARSTSALDHQLAKGKQRREQCLPCRIPAVTWI